MMMRTILLATMVTMSGAKWGGAFPVYANARQLCDQHVAGNSMHIDWQSYAVTDSVTKVSAFYEKQLGAKPEIDDAGGRSWHAQSDKDLILTVIATSSADKVPSCDKTFAKGEHTLIIVSKAIR
jgi:hypothetical protein